LAGLVGDSVPPPFTPGKDIHAHSQAQIGQFMEDLSKITVTEDDDEVLRSWNFSSNSAFNREVMSILKQDKGSSSSSSSSSAAGGGGGSSGGVGNSGGDGGSVRSHASSKSGASLPQPAAGGSSCCSIS
jgi:hypothetical protein